MLALIAALLVLVVVAESVKKCWGVCGRGNWPDVEIDGDFERVVDETPLGGAELYRPQNAVRRPHYDYLCNATGSGILIGLCKCLFCWRVRVRVMI